MASGAALAGGVLVALAAYTLYTLYGAYWRLYLSPVAKFPTRKLAALTSWYEFYYDVIKGVAYVYEIEKMHKELGERHHRRPSKCFLFSIACLEADNVAPGPVVRINPYELSVSDPDLDFLNRLCPSVGKQADKFW